MFDWLWKKPLVKSKTICLNSTRISHVTSDSQGGTWLTITRGSEKKRCRVYPNDEIVISRQIGISLSEELE